MEEMPPQRDEELLQQLVFVREGRKRVSDGSDIDVDLKITEVVKTGNVYTFTIDALIYYIKQHSQDSLMINAIGINSKIFKATVEKKE